MPVVYHLIKTKYAENAFDGYGAKKHGGRWNSKGIPLSYVADSPSLAVLEILVHLLDPDELQHYTLCSLQLEELDILELAADALPADWRADPAPSSTAAIGDEWYASQSSLALTVSSTIIPEQNILLLNPDHPDFQRVLATANCVPYALDRRLK